MHEYRYIAAGSGGGHLVRRSEQAYSGGWVDDFRVTYKHDALGRQFFEQREDWDAGGSQWLSRYDITQAYDKNGNRTGYDKNVGGAAALTVADGWLVAAMAWAATGQFPEQAHIRPQPG